MPIKDKYLQYLYKRHRRAAFVRAGTSILMWLSAVAAYGLGFIHTHNFISDSVAVLYLILMNPPLLWVLKRIESRSRAASFILFIHLLEIIGYTAVIHAFGGIEATYLLPIYAALIASVGIMGPRGMPYIVAGLSSICFGGMLALEHFGVLPSLKINPLYYVSWQNQIAIAVIVFLLLSMVAFIASYTAKVLKTQSDTLRRQNEELQEVVAMARESERLKSEFLANISHELRTPLNAIIGFSDLLTDQYLGELNERQQEATKNINISGRLLLLNIDDLLEISKVEAGKMELEASETNLRKLLEENLNLFQEEGMKRGIRLTSEIKDCPEKIWADERKMSKILYNLLSNALKFTLDRGSVHLSVRQLIWNGDNWATNKGDSVSIPVRDRPERLNHDGLVQITVADTGIGMTLADQKRIFNPFVQADGSPSRRYQGTGLGLYMTKRFVEMHLGDIWVESGGEGKGSTFHVVVPL